MRVTTRPGWVVLTYSLIINTDGKREIWFKREQLEGGQHIVKGNGTFSLTLAGET